VCSGRIPAGRRQRVQGSLPLGPDTVPASGWHQVGAIRRRNLLPLRNSFERLAPHQPVCLGCMALVLKAAVWICHPDLGGKTERIEYLLPLGVRQVSARGTASVAQQKKRHGPANPALAQGVRILRQPKVRYQSRVFHAWHLIEPIACIAIPQSNPSEATWINIRSETPRRTDYLLAKRCRQHAIHEPACRRRVHRRASY